MCAELAQWQRHVCLASVGATIDAGQIGRGTLHQPGLPHDKDRSRIKLYVDIVVCSNNFLRVWAGEIPPTIDGANNPPTMAAAPLSSAHHDARRESRLAMLLLAMLAAIVMLPAT